MPKGRVELPSRKAGHGPKPCASANSATSARKNLPANVCLRPILIFAFLELFAPAQIAILGGFRPALRDYKFRHFGLTSLNYTINFRELTTNSSRFSLILEKNSLFRSEFSASWRIILLRSPSSRLKRRVFGFLEIKIHYTSQSHF